MSVECVATAKDVLHRPTPALFVVDECQNLRTQLNNAIAKMNQNKTHVFLSPYTDVSSTDVLRLKIEFLKRGFCFNKSEIWVANNRELRFRPKELALLLAIEECLGHELKTALVFVMGMIIALSIWFGIGTIVYLYLCIWDSDDTPPISSFTPLGLTVFSVSNFIFAMSVLWEVRRLYIGKGR